MKSEIGKATATPSTPLQGMMWKYSVILASIFWAQGSFAMEPSYPKTLDELFTAVKGLRNAQGVPGIFETIKAQNPEVFKSLCGEIKETDFYDKADAAGITVTKRNAILNACQGLNLERADFKKLAVQKEKAAEVSKEVVHLKPVDFTKKTMNVEEEKKELEAAQKIILENAEKLGKKAEFEAKFAVVEKSLREAQDFYDNLGVAITFMREDLKEFKFQVFKPHDHDNDTPDQYLEALEKSLPHESPSLLNKNSKEQLTIASNLLKQANENLANARKDLEAINREMLEMTKS